VAPDVTKRLLTPATAALLDDLKNIRAACSSIMMALGAV